MFRRAATLGLLWVVLLFGCTSGEVVGSTDAGADERFLDPNTLTPRPETPDEEAERDGIDLDAERMVPDDAALDDVPKMAWDDVPDPPIPTTEEPPVVELPDDAPLDALSSQGAGGNESARCNCPWCGPWVCAAPPATRRTGNGYALVFNERDASGTPSTAIEGANALLIRMATPGSTIRIAMCHFRQECVAWALINAARCGVHVRVVIDGPRNQPTEGASSYYPAVEALLAEGRRLDALHDPNGGSIRVAGCRSRDRGSCLGVRLMHDKFITVSHRDDRTPALSDGTMFAVGVSSHNFTAPQNVRHNAMVVVRNDVGILNAYNRRFDQMEASPGPKHPDNPYVFEEGEGDRSRAYFFPRTDGPDTYIQELERVRCDGRARIFVAMAFFTNSRLEVARALRNLHDQGCAVQVVIDDALLGVSGRVVSILRQGPRPVPLWIYRGAPWGLHSKYVLIDAAVSDRNGRVARVLTGSHNFSSGSLRDNDENILRIDNGRVFNAFLRDWQRIRGFSQRRP